MKKWVRRRLIKMRQKRQFKKDKIMWVNSLAKMPKAVKRIGVCKVGELTHKIEIKNVGKIVTSDPILVYKDEDL